MFLPILLACRAVVLLTKAGPRLPRRSAFDEGGSDQSAMSDQSDSW
jgi:hypothetical protein